MRGMRRARSITVRRARQTSRRPRRAVRSRLVVLLVALTALAGCSGAIAGTAVIVGGFTGSVDPAPATSAVPPAPVPAGLETFYGQQLDWGSCRDFAANNDQLAYFRLASLQCARLTVPLSYDDPAGPTVDLAVLRSPATDDSGRIGSLMVNPGGPGVSGILTVAQLVGTGISSVRTLNRSFDLVGFDPRGVGASSPAIRCQTDAQRDAARATTQRTRTPQEIAAANASVQQYADGCLSLSRSDAVTGEQFLPQVGTDNVARDMDVLRAAVGDPRLNYVGFSYGTAIGTSYAAQFPANVRAMILDGAIDPNADPAGELVGQSDGFQKAFEAFGAWCAQRPDCVLGSDPSQSTAVYQQLVRPLLDKPLELSDGRVLTFGDATTGTVYALYAEALWPTLSTALLELSRGDGTALMALADSYDERDSTGQYSNTLDVLAVVNCVDGSDAGGNLTDADLQKIAAAAPFLDSGDPPVVTDSVCEKLPPSPDKPVELGSLTGLPTTLVYSTTGDPATPYQSGVDLATALGARLVTVNGNSHTAFLNTGSTCVDDIGLRYLIALELPPADTTC